MKKANILFISYDGMTDPLGQSQVIPYLKGLTKYGFQFTILSCEKPDKYALYKNDIKNILEGFPIKWVPIKYNKNPPVLSSMYDLWSIKKKAKQLHQTEKFDLVHTRSGTPALAGLWLKKKFGIKFLHDVRDFFADSRIDNGSWNYNNILYRSIYKYFKKKEAEELKACDGVVCLTSKAKEIIQQSKYFDTKKIIEVIPCSVDMELFDPEKISLQSKDSLKKELGIKNDEIVFSYLGSTGGWYLTDEMMQLCAMISNKIAGAKFLFITPDKAEKVLSASQKFGIDSEKIIIKYVRRQDIPSLLSLSNYSIFFIKPCFSKKSSSPTKHGEIMAMGIPLITNSGVGDVKEIVEKYNSGIVIENFSVADYKEVIRRMKNSSFNKNEIRNGAKEFYSLDNAIQKYLHIYKTILNS